MRTEEIKRLPIKRVLDCLWVEYFAKWWSEYGIYDKGQKTSWRSFNEEKNLIWDFSHGDRAHGDVFGFVKAHEKLNDQETFKRFEEKFGISTEEQKSLMSIWRSLPKMSEEQKAYLSKRNINPELVTEIVRDYNGGIWCLVYENEIAKGMNARTLSSEHTKRFIALSWFPTKWIYQHKIDKEKKYIIVVEWLIDFLTLRQYDTNVIWLKSAESGIEEVIQLAKKHEIIFIWDNDEAWKKTREKLNGIKYKFFDVSEFGNYKDINEMECDTKAWDVLIDFIKEKSVWVLPITSAFEKLKAITTRLKTHGKLWEDWPIKEVYDAVSWVIPWLVYTIGAYSNTWKSKFAYFHIWYFLSIGKKVCLMSLEVDEAIALLEVIIAREWVTRHEIIQWHEPKKQLYQNFCIKNDIYKLSDITDFIMLGEYDIYFIDFVQNIQEKGSAYEMHASIAKWLQRAATLSGKTLFNLSQLSNQAAKDMKLDTPSVPQLKWAWEYYASSDIVFMLQRVDQEWKIKLSIAKNKYEKKLSTYLLDVDFARNNFKFFSQIKIGRASCRERV